MSFCTKCGQKLEEGEQRCTNCGKVVQQVAKDNRLNKGIAPTSRSRQNVSFIGKLKQIKLRLAVIIFVLMLCLISGGLGLLKYTNAVQVKEGLALGNKYVQEGKYEEAILAFEKVIKIDPKSIEARVGLANTYAKTGRSDEAKKILRECISINPKKVEPYLELAKLYIDENNSVNAIKILTDGYKVTNDISIKSFLEDLKSKIVVNDIDKPIIFGENYSLPKEVAVNINNTSIQFPVKWDVTSIDTTKIGVNVITGTLEDTDKVVKLTINVIGIALIEDINVAINQNDKYSLPSKVTARMTDGSTRDINITWSPSGVDTSMVGSYSYEGTVLGYNNKVKLTLNIVGIASIENISATINQNDKYLLPSKVTAKMTDGSTRDVEVTWSPSGVDTSKVGSYTYQGIVSGYNDKVKLTLNIKAKQTADDYTPAMAIQLAKKYDGVANNDDITGEVWGPFYENGKKYYTVRLYSKSTAATGSSQTYDVITIARDGSVIGNLSY